MVIMWPSNSALSATGRFQMSLTFGFEWSLLTQSIVIGQSFKAKPNTSCGIERQHIFTDLLSLDKLGSKCGTAEIDKQMNSLKATIEQAGRGGGGGKRSHASSPPVGSQETPRKRPR